LGIERLGTGKIKNGFYLDIGNVHRAVVDGGKNSLCIVVKTTHGIDQLQRRKVDGWAGGAT